MTERPPTRPGTRLEQVGPLVAAALRDLGAPQAPTVAVLAECWDEIAGDLAAAGSPLGLHHGTLVVLAVSAAAATRLRYGAATLLARLQERVGSEVSRLEVRTPRPSGPRPAPGSALP